MNIEQRYKLSSLTKDMEKIINNSNSLTSKYNEITEVHISETQYIEQSLRYIYQRLFNIVSYLKFDSEEYEIIKEIVQTLSDVINEKQDIYSYSVISGNEETKYTTDRKGHVLGILEWALDFIVGNIETED
ncbi:TscA family type II toxin-antitoxin system antitoxin [Staphylococcus aureus]|uniref:TscA family type II toxin-antitoxin system antitoxin n=1 Tax=Staphylococcus aureus TaxID=1280 RepID=UPI001886B6B5|nr:pathogenicity island protein [Staphylococcus aureus]MBF2706237.1 pathogenicity island protein [Staphylococcus aureus]MBF2722791.1 pathogenicity island protein [Staphylococcus aureus]MBU6092601.1 pathogenicity island protein [Staphylococcus aureus]MBU6935482.1 pathogenicity island protein [Staphylococcus aureus]MBU7224570.1 pathogenicity island protein [Staphylococcus aureus]